MFFSEAERLIFEYHDGERPRCGDPLALRDAMAEACAGDIDTMVELASHDPAWLKAARAARDAGEPPPPVAPMDILRMADGRRGLRAAVCQAFKLAPFDEETKAGCTAAMVDRVWAAFCEFLAGKGARGGDSPVSPPSTGSSPPDAT